MKISKPTLVLLKNFSEINKSIIIRKGNVLSTISPDRSVFGKAEVDENFPVECPIWDIHKFLAAIDLLGEPDLEFGERSVLLQSQNRRLTFEYADESSLNTSKGTLKPPKGGVQFNLSADDLKGLNNASSVLQLPHVCVSSEDGSVQLSVVDDENKLANTFVIDLEAKTDTKFKVLFRVARFRVLPGAYSVTVYRASEDVICGYFKHESKELEYWVAAEDQSAFHGDVEDPEADKKRKEKRKANGN